jgi:pimeloyl-ACP methyl ester carboxylesterase
VFHKALITPQVVERRHRLSTGKNVQAAERRSETREPRQDGKPAWLQLADLTQPLTMLYGDHDRAAAGRRALLLKEQQPEIDVRVVANAAHMLMWDRPDVFLPSLLDFLNRVHASSKTPAAIELAATRSGRRRNGHGRARDRHRHQSPMEPASCR